MIRLSIIIPVYNAEKYLERCVKSCMNQGLAEDEYEILLCNDGSTDSSLAIAEGFSQKHNCIKVYSQENAGAGMARNLGLEHAVGQYVMFVDSDDYLMPHILKSYLGVCETNYLDICRCVLGAQNLNSDKIRKRIVPLPVRTIYTGHQLLMNRQVPLDSICAVLFKNVFLKENKLRFSTLKTSEDVEFNFQVLLQAKRVMYVDDLVYIYLEHAGSRGRPIDVQSVVAFRKNELKIASIIKNESRFHDERMRRALLTRSNSITVGSFMMLLKMRRIMARQEVKSFLSYAIKLGVYPIVGRALSWKSTLLAHMFFNQKKILFFMFNE